MKKQGKLELTWVGKYEEKIVEPRILVEDKSKSYGDPDAENIIIHGDNLIALKALEQDYAGKIKCVYIDPPYNTGSAFEHYDDNLEHSIWLNLIKQRIEILRNLLSEDGFLCCHIDDSEGHYLKVVLDELFGRGNYLTTLYVRVRYPDKTLKSDMDFHKEIEQILIYRKRYGAIPNLHEKASSFEKFIYFFEELGEGEKIELGGKKVEVFRKGKYKILKKEASEYGLKEIWATGTILNGNSSGRFFRDYLTGRYVNDGYGTMYKVYGIGDDRYDYRYFTGPNKVGATKGKYFQGVPIGKLNAEDSINRTPINGFYDLAGSFGNCRQEGGAAFRGGKKPEVLLEMIIRYFSDENEIVLDSFLGSGTTAAVAHKMNRRWIGIEMGDHCYSLCRERLKKVVDGADNTGVTAAVNWKGGGGFKFYELAESLLVKNDILPVYQINPSYTFDMMTEAICKLEGFKYKPVGEYHGTSSENRFIHVTIEFVNSSYIISITKKLDKNQSLLVYCTKKQSAMVLPNNVEIKIIPKDLLDKCNFESERLK
jgi:adenine-specific DNA-methyltransferase